MPEQRIGECSICGGDVVYFVGVWMSIIPPPPPHCTSCGAVSAAHDPVIPMRPCGPRRAKVTWAVSQGADDESFVRRCHEVYLDQDLNFV